jgi:hypothetical protein
MFNQKSRQPEQGVCPIDGAKLMDDFMNNVLFSKYVSKVVSGDS